MRITWSSLTRTLAGVASVGSMAIFAAIYRDAPAVTTWFFLGLAVGMALLAALINE